VADRYVGGIDLGLVRDLSAVALAVNMHGSSLDAIGETLMRLAE